MDRTRSVTFARDAVVATLVLVGLYGLAFGVQFPPFQIPGYLLVVGFDFVEVVFGSAGGNYDLLFAVYLVCLGVVSAAVAHVFGTDAVETTLSQWRLGAAGALATVGVISLLFAVNVLVSTTQTTPVLVTGATGLVSIALAGLLSGRVRLGFGTTQ